MKKTTIKDVANHAGVSIASVSYVLNGKESKVSLETIEKIHHSIKELNYIPNFTARSLVKNSTKLIGVMIPQTEDHKQMLFENPFYSEVISGIEGKFREFGYHLIISGVDKGKHFLDLSVQRNLDGAIIMGIYSEQFYAEFKQIKIPIILIDSYINNSYFRKVGSDDEQGGYLATNYLIQAGHRNIALVTGSIKTDGVVEKRFLGYKKALTEADVFYNPEYVFEDSVSYDHGLNMGRHIAKNRPEITAIFAASDMVALGVIRGLKESGKEVPQDISVIGFDDISFAKIFLPQLTTVKQNIILKGQMAAEQLLELIENKTTDSNNNEKTLLPLEIVERQTVRKLTTRI